MKSSGKEVNTVEVIPVSGYDKTLTYMVPTDLRAPLEVGSLVKIPLGRRSCMGIVSNTEGSSNVELSKLKRIHELYYPNPVMTADTIKLAKWMQSYYAASSESVLEAMIPSPVRKGMRPKIEKFLEIGQKISPEELIALKKKAPKQGKVYSFLSDQLKPVLQSKVLSDLKITAAVCNGLVKKGIVREIINIKERSAYEDDFSEAEMLKNQAIELNDEQKAAAEHMVKSLDARKFAVHLLHGVTGSGKTEVYLHAAQRVLETGGSIIYLVPEVALTPQTVGRMRSRLETLGTKTVVWHSHLSSGERFDGWMSLAKGDARIVVGARSAIFAPLKNLRLIIVDEEHEPAYKQTETPRYHGRDVAVYRAMLNNAVCVVGSATPSLETLYNVKSERYLVDRLTKRVDDRKLPSFQIVDMKREMISNRGIVTISRLMANHLRDRLEKKEQSILFLNRRGYSSRMICSECGYIAMSPDSSVSMTYHRTDETMRCHLTGHQEPAPRQCPECASGKIVWRGFGTQKIEDVLQKILPHGRIVRMDTDTMSKKNLFRSVLADFRRGKIDVLVGTQMIAKGLDFPNVTLVGIVDADLSMHMSDFRSSERTFQLLVQVAGRAGRGDRAGEVVVQTYLPSSAPIQFAKRADFDGFFETELEERKEFGYPPFRHIIRHIFRGRNDEKVFFFAEQWARFLEKELGAELIVRGPSPAPLEKVKGFYRFHLWYFTNKVSKIMPQIQEIRSRFMQDKDVIDVFDVDPVDMS